MKQLCLVSISMHPQARRLLETRYSITTAEEDLARIHAAIVYGVPEDWLSDGRQPNCRVIACHSCPPAVMLRAEQRGIRIVLAESLWRTVAEHTLALMLATARNLIPADRAIRSGEWTPGGRDLKAAYSGRDVQKRTLGILGMGNIGVELAGMLTGFRAKVLYHDIRRLPVETEQDLCVDWRSLDGLLQESDVLFVLVPLRDETRGMLDRQAFSRMKKGCLLVNTARAGIVNEEAFLEALADGTLGASALDVLWDEGMPQKPELTRNDRVVLSPHLGGSTLECDMVLVEAVCGLVMEDA